MQHSCGIKNISLHGLREAVAWEITRDEQFSPRLRGIALFSACGCMASLPQSTRSVVLRVEKT